MAACDVMSRDDDKGAPGATVTLFVPWRADSVPRRSGGGPRLAPSISDAGLRPQSSDDGGRLGASVAVRELGRDLRDVVALGAGGVEFIGARLARIATPDDRAGAAGRAAGNVVLPQLSLEGIGQADDDHASMEQGEQGRL